MISLWMISHCLIVLVGLCVLVWYRNRSRKATTIGIIALCGYGLFMSLPFVVPLALGLFGLGEVPYTVTFIASLVGWTLCLLLLVIAIVIDRR